jgi:hypothetical protein
MPWYYAGPEAKPVGPISLEELNARRVNGTISPVTYIIEYTGQPTDPRVWKRYQDVFPASPSLPPLPPALPAAVPSAPAIQPHPLFPSAGSAHAGQSGLPPGSPHDLQGTSNPWCRWGFGLGLASLILLIPTCGLTAFIALPAFFVSIAGLIQVLQNPNQRGRNRAICGLFLSGLTLLLAVIILAVAIPWLIKEREQTTTEQSTNDSE